MCSIEARGFVESGKKCLRTAKTAIFVAWGASGLECVPPKGPVGPPSAAPMADPVGVVAILEDVEIAEIDGIASRPYWIGTGGESLTGKLDQEQKSRKVKELNRMSLPSFEDIQRLHNFNNNSFLVNFSI